MITCGVDIEDISIFKAKDEEFLTETFTAKELRYCFRAKNPAPHLALRYCAKIAVIKALSQFTDIEISHSKIEILKHSNGAPYINILDNELQSYNFNLSLSQDGDKAVAFVIVTNKGDSYV